MERLKHLFASSSRFIGIYGTDKGDTEPADHAFCEQLGQFLYASDPHHVIFTGACSGLPAEVSTSFRGQGGVTVGVSPGGNLEEHSNLYSNPVAPYQQIVFLHDCQQLEYPAGFQARRHIVMEHLDLAVIIKGNRGSFKEIVLLLKDFDCTLYLLTGHGGSSEYFEKLVQDVREGTVTRENIMPAVEAAGLFTIDQELTDMGGQVYDAVVRGIEQNRIVWIRGIADLEAIREIRPKAKDHQSLFSRIHHVCETDNLPLSR